MLLLLLAPQGSPSTGVNLSSVIGSVLASLNAGSVAELVFWSEGELYQFADDGAKRLARLQGGFVERDNSTAIVVGTPSYALPARHLSTIHVSVDDLALRESNVQEVEALDDDWLDTASPTLERWLQDLAGLDSIRLYPTPDTGASGQLAEIFHRYPVEVTVIASTVTAPRCLQGYWWFHVVAEARGRESKAAMPDVAQWARGMTALYEATCREYWGGAQ